MPASWSTVSQAEYDAAGLLTKKKLGAAPLDSLVYDYNIRGWLLGANRNYVKDTMSTINWFGFDLGYDKTSFTVNGLSRSYSAAQYNGNITGTMWKSTGDDELRKYDFTYDAVNRLTGADFNQLTAGIFSKNALVDFSVFGLTYDANGNIQALNQKGWKLGGSVTIDSLLYTYMSNNNSNKLLNVLDRKNDTATRLGDFRSSKAYMTALGNNKTTSATDYSYDPNGNLTVDNNKDISYVHYNHLNLPDSIVVSNKGTITYLYDATGNKLKKVTTEGAKITTTLYLFGNFVNDTLQFLPQEEGRVRFDTTKRSLYFDYFVKDHLGNVRMILTEQKDTSFYPAASLETAQLTSERILYSKVDSGRVNKSTVSGYPTDTYTNPNDYIQKLNGNGVKIGTGIVLKVMAGDQFNLRVNSWWSSGNTPSSPISPLNDIVAALAGSVGNIPGKPSSTELLNSGALPPGATSFLNGQIFNVNIPKAFINWILFDERFNYVANSSGFEQVGTSGTFTTHTRNNLTLKKSGYLYVYVSNETPNIDVFFDNLQVTQIRGPLTEETHYYPFGLTMQALSSKALGFGVPKNRRKYGGKEEQREEFTDGNGLEWLDFEARMYDNQLGRFNSMDPKAQKFGFVTPYNYCLNNPLNFVDPNGKDAIVEKVYDPNDKEHKKVIGLKVTATIYIYGDQANKDLAAEMQKSINDGWNKESSADDQGKVTSEGSSTNYLDEKVPVTFDVKVVAVGDKEAKEQLSKHKKGDNFLRVYNGDDDTHGSTFRGNSGALDLCQNKDQNGTTLVHEVGHMLGFRVPGGNGADHFDSKQDGLAPIMWAQNIPSSEVNQRVVTPSDVKGLNLGIGLLGTKLQTRSIGNPNTNKILLTNDEINEFRHNFKQ